MTSPSPLIQGEFYHINRGNNRDLLFFEERNYHYFLSLYAKHVAPVVDTYAYCLLPNHFHFLVRVKTPEEIEAFRISRTLKVSSPSQQFGNLFNAYAKAVNRAYSRTGSLFQNPFGRVNVSSNDHLTYLVCYIHCNPQKHNPSTDFRRWTFSSFQTILSRKPTQLRRDIVLGWCGGTEPLIKAHDGLRLRHELEFLIGTDP
jgi:REP element-mobilizing transposase RayT